jgi:hypothetical protein
MFGAATESRQRQMNYGIFDQSGRGLPHSKTWRMFGGPMSRGSLMLGARKLYQNENPACAP